MAWIATENFDSYTPGAGLNGGAGGSNWTAGWNANAGFTTETAPAGGQGGVCARKSGTSSDLANRPLTGVAAGVIHWQMRLSAVPSVDQFIGVQFSNAVQNVLHIKMTNGGNISMFDGNLGDYVTIQAYSVDTWYSIDVEFDAVGQPNQYRVKVDNGSWTIYRDAELSFSTIIGIQLLDAYTTSHNFYVDDIRAGDRRWILGPH